MSDHPPRSLLHRLTEPHASVRESERRRSRLLSYLLLALVGLAVASLVVVFVVNASAAPIRDRYTVLIPGLILALGAAYGLNRAGRYFAAAWLTIGIVTLGTWISVVLESATVSGNFGPLIFTALPVFLCSILLSVAATTLLAAIQISGLVLMSALYGAIITPGWPTVVIFVFILSVLSVVASLVTRQDLAQIERQTRALAESEAQMREQSVRDALTGLFNRRYLDETLERELRRAERAGQPLGIVMIDIDHFKRFNDTYGHAAGDAVLRDLGALLCANVRGSDIACRYGGEEFVLLMPEAPSNITRARAERVRESARKLNVRDEGRAVEPVTLSFGLAAFPQDGATSDLLLKAADVALYRAKHEGGDQIA